MLSTPEKKKTVMPACTFKRTAVTKAWNVTLILSIYSSFAVPLGSSADIPLIFHKTLMEQKVSLGNMLPGNKELLCCDVR